MTDSNCQRLRLLTYMVPDIPLGTFTVIRDCIEEATGLEVDLIVEDRYSGPCPARVNPFTQDLADIGMEYHLITIINNCFLYHINHKSFPWLSFFMRNILVILESAITNLFVLCLTNVTYYMALSCGKYRTILAILDKAPAWRK